MAGRNAIEWPELDVDLEIESLKHPERYPLIMKRSTLDFDNLFFIKYPSIVLIVDMLGYFF